MVSQISSRRFPPALSPAALALAPEGPLAPGRKVYVPKVGLGIVAAVPGSGGDHMAGGGNALVQLPDRLVRVPASELVPFVYRSELPMVAGVPHWLRAHVRMDSELVPAAKANPTRGLTEDCFKWETVERLRAQFQHLGGLRIHDDLPEPERVRLAGAIAASHHTDFVIATAAGLGKATVYRLRTGTVATTPATAQKIYEALERLHRDGVPRTQSISKSEAVALQREVKLLHELGWSFQPIAHACGCAQDLIRLVHNKASRPGYDLAQQIRAGIKALKDASTPLPELAFRPDDIALLLKRLQTLPIRDDDTLNHVLGATVWSIVVSAAAAGHGPPRAEDDSRHGRPLLGKAKKMLEDLATLPPQGDGSLWNPPPGTFPLWDPSPRFLPWAELATLRAEIEASGYNDPTIAGWVTLDRHTVHEIRTGGNTTPETAALIRRALSELKAAKVPQDRRISDAELTSLAKKVNAVHALGWSFETMGAVTGFSGSFVFLVGKEDERAEIGGAAEMRKGLNVLSKNSAPMPEARFCAEDVAALRDRLETLETARVPAEALLARPLAEALWQVAKDAKRSKVYVTQPQQRPGERPQLERALGVARELAAALGV